jgi:hypothetical protein
VVVEVRLKDLTDFKWDRVYIFTPYTPHKVIDDDLGLVWKPARSIQMDWRDDVNLIVFTENGKVVFYIEHPRGLGDLKGNYNCYVSRISINLNDEPGEGSRPSPGSPSFS